MQQPLRFLTPLPRRAVFLLVTLATIIAACSLDIAGTLDVGTSDPSGGASDATVAVPGTSPVLSTLPDAAPSADDAGPGVDAAGQRGTDGAIASGGDAAKGPDGAGAPGEVTYACATGPVRHCADCAGASQPCVYCDGAGHFARACEVAGYRCSQLIPSGMTLCPCEESAACPESFQTCHVNDAGGTCRTCGEPRTSGGTCKGGGTCEDGGTCTHAGPIGPVGKGGLR